MTGCRRGAKNMLTENYLYLAERAGAGHPADHGHRGMATRQAVTASRSSAPGR